MEEDHDLLDLPVQAKDVVDDGASTHQLLQRPGVGKPARKHRLTLIDILTLILSMLCLGVGILLVRHDPLAATLGQTYQFVLLGFLLSVMGFAVKRQTQLLLITLEARYGKSSLQNYDAILRNDNLAPLVGIALRISLLALFILPLGLSAAYKTFGNGKTTLRLHTANGSSHHLRDPVGDLSWVGVALMANVTLPIQTNIKNPDPTLLRFPSSYGFNMYAINESATAMLDSPTRPYVDSIQSTLRDGGSMSKSLNEEVQISAEVGAIICSVDQSSVEPVDRQAFWAIIYQ